MGTGGCLPTAREGTRRAHPTATQHSAGVVAREDREIRGIWTGKQETQPPLITANPILHTEITKKLTEKPLQLINEFLAKPQDTRSLYKQTVALYT